VREREGREGDPALHSQSLTDVESLGEFEFTGQFVHWVPDLYVPGV